MLPSRVLYYPWIDVHDIAWLKKAILYWDEISTLVPAGIAEPYESREAKEIANRGWLTPIYISPDDAAVHKATKYLRDQIFHHYTWGRNLLHGESTPSNDPFTTNWHLQECMTVHSAKGIFHALSIQQQDGRDEQLTSPWIRVRTPIAALYLTTLAAYVAKQSGLSLATGDTGLAPWAEAARLGTGIRSDVTTSGMLLPQTAQTWDPSFMWGPRMRFAALADLSFTTVAIHPSTPIEKLIRFREHHQSEMDRFRIAVQLLSEQLADEYEDDTALRQALRDIYNGEIRPAIDELARAQSAAGIEAGQDVLRSTGFSLSPSIIALGTGHPFAATIAGAIGVGLSLAISALMVKEKRLRVLRGQPFAFVLSARREFD